MTFSTTDAGQIFDTARRLYAEKNLDFDRELLEYSRLGYVYASPECLILATASKDTWFIQFAIGKDYLQRFLQVAPFPLEYISWKRGLKTNSVIKRFKMSSIERIIYGRKPTITTAS